MNSSFRIITASTATLFACCAVAQQTSDIRSPIGIHGSTNHGWQAMPKPYGAAVKASDILGITVHNYKQEKLGKVEEIGIDIESGRIVHVIISSGGVLGVGSRQTAVPPTALHHDPTLKVVHLESDAEKLKAAPEFADANWVEHSNLENLTTAYRYHGREQELGFIHPNGVRVVDGLTNRGFGPKPLPSGAVNPTRREQVRTTDEQLRKNGIAKGDRSMLPVARLAHLQKASVLKGMSVRNLQDEAVGKVDNLLLDLASGRVVAVVIESGGFLGMNGELSAVPPAAFAFTDDRDALRLDTTKEALANAPHFSGNQWPSFDQSTYPATIYRAHRVEPYFTQVEGLDADNSGRNERDRKGRGLTPLDQGNSESDVDITARIRKDVISGKNFSVNARNVKIITRDGQVTLRGPVASLEEKRVIGEIAQRIAAPGKVDNQLEVTITRLQN
jgi:sporulation protein YlmC with PRC-barrel domain